MLRYSLFVTASCVACMTSSPLIRLYFWLVVIGAHVARMRRNLWWLAVMRLRSPPEARGQCPISANLRHDSFAVGGQPGSTHHGGNRQALTGTSGFPQTDLSG